MIHPHWSEEASLGPEQALRACWSDEQDDGVAHCLRYISPHVHGTVQDIGCGVGRLAIPLALSRPDSIVVGVDPCEEMINAAPPTPANCGLLHRDLPDYYHPCHTAYTVAVLQHLPGTAASELLRYAARCLAPGGTLVAQFTFGHDEGPLSFSRDPTRMAQMALDAGFADSTCERDDVFPTWGWMVARKAER